MNMNYLNCTSPIEFIRAAIGTGPGKVRSVRQLSFQLGYSSDRGLGMVRKGQRAMSSEMQNKLARFLGLSDKERVHLQQLVRQQTGRAQKDPPQVKKHARAVNKDLSGAALHPFVPWYAFAILDLLRIHRRELKIEEIQSRLHAKVRFEELARTLDVLCENRMIKAEADGYFRTLRDEEYVSTPIDVPSKIVRDIHRAQLTRAMSTLEEQSVMEREFIAKTLVIPRGDLSKVKRLIRDKLEELAAEIAVEHPQTDALVAQLNLQFYLQSR